MNKSTEHKCEKKKKKKSESNWNQAWSRSSELAIWMQSALSIVFLFEFNACMNTSKRRWHKSNLRCLCVVQWIVFVRSTPWRCGVCVCVCVSSVTELEYEIQWNEMQTEIWCVGIVNLILFAYKRFSMTLCLWHCAAVSLWLTQFYSILFYSIIQSFAKFAFELYFAIASINCQNFVYARI